MGRGKIVIPIFVCILISITIYFKKNCNVIFITIHLFGDNTKIEP